jgi:hypothetical protein
VSHHALQRALVVALHDPGFARALRDDPRAVLAPFQLDAAERDQLLAVDPRAFALDPLRRRRVLKAIVEELKGSMAIALAEVRRFELAEEFFASPRFRAAVIEDGPLVLALADYLADQLGAGHLRAPQLAGVLAIERAQAEARRDCGRVPAPGLSAAPGLRLVAADRSALAALQAAERHLFELALLPHIALCDDRPALALPPVGGEPLHLAVRADGDEVGLSELPEPLYRSLGALVGAASRGLLQRADVPAILASVRLRVADTDLLVDDLVTDGYLVERPGDTCDGVGGAART